MDLFIGSEEPGTGNLFWIYVCGLSWGVDLHTHCRPSLTKPFPLVSGQDPQAAALLDLFIVTNTCIQTRTKADLRAFLTSAGVESSLCFRESFRLGSLRSAPGSDSIPLFLGLHTTQNERERETGQFQVLLISLSVISGTRWAGSDLSSSALQAG